MLGSSLGGRPRCSPSETLHLQRIELRRCNLPLQDRSHAGNVPPCVGSERDSIATTASEFEHHSHRVIQGPETASQSVAVENIPCP